MSRVLECVANFSEGRREEVIERVVAAARGPGIHVLDVHSDPDHNRSVLTLAGAPDALIDGVVGATRRAVAEIDIGAHEGVHPRLGSMDVVPFVPVLASLMQDAVDAALRYSARICDELEVPSFLYEEAAAAHLGEARSLPAVRKAAFRSLRPDFGGPRPHPSAGAVMVGARGPLAAYNVELATRDGEIARRIAKQIRMKGGLPHLRALGLPLASRGIVQVSMNLLNPAEVTIADAFDAVARAAEAEGVGVAGAELVGLVPRVALGGREPRALGLRSSPKILEEELSRVFGG